MEYKKFYDYDVYEDGRIYSHKTNKFLTPDIVNNGYHQYTLSIDGKPKRYKAHQLVGRLFLGDPPKGKELINHKDGIKDNNNYSNLEWCNYYENNKHARETGLNNVSKSNSERWKDEEFRRKTSANISKGIILNGSQKGTKNANFRYLVTDDSGEYIDRNSLAKIIGRSQSNTDVLIKKAANGEKINLFEENNIIVIDTKNPKIEGASTIESDLDREIRPNNIHYLNEIHEIKWEVSRVGIQLKCCIRW